VRLAIKSLNDLNQQDKYDICASFQKTAVEHLLHKLKNILKNYSHEVNLFSIVGGASANKYLRDKISNLCKKFDLELKLADLKYCSDNAAMIGRYAIEAYNHNYFININDIKISPRI